MTLSNTTAKRKIDIMPDALKLSMIEVLYQIELFPLQLDERIFVAGSDNL